MKDVLISAMKMFMFLPLKLPALKPTGWIGTRRRRYQLNRLKDGIRRADACLADVSTNNPNVWFELGFAIAAGKPVILVCEFQEGRRFPFDIQHRSIISYKSESARDFETLRASITQRLQAAIAKENKIERLAQSTQIADVEGLNPHEVVALVTIAENLNTPNDSVATHSIRSDMERAGYTRIAATLALTSLLRKGMAQSSDVPGEYEDYTVYSLTESGMSWLLDNQDMFVLRRESQQKDSTKQFNPADDVPF